MQAHSPVDSAVISGIDNEVNEDEEPRDEAGACTMSYVSM